MTLTIEPMKEITSANTLAAELIHEHNERSSWPDTACIAVAPEHGRELRQGVAEGRGAWGIAETSRGRVRWDVSWNRFRECNELTYHLVDPPIPTRNPNHAATSIATGYALNSVQSKARYHLTASLTSYKSHPVTVKLEAWVVTLCQKDKVLTHWNTLKATNIQEEQLREPTEDEVSQDAYYHVTGKRIHR